MKPISWLSLLLIPVFILAGCTPASPSVQPTQEMQPSSSVNSSATNIVVPTSTPTLSGAKISSSTTTQTSPATLEPESAKETMEPLLHEPMNCAEPCFLGIMPGKTQLDEIRAFFNPLDLPHKEGKDSNSGEYIYSVAYEANLGRDFSVIFYLSDNLVENIVLTPHIVRQKEGNPRAWTAYTPETLMKKYGKPSRVYFAIDMGQVNTTISMILYFDSIDLIALYSGYDNIAGHPSSPRFCPFIFPFDLVELWMGETPPDPPLFPMMPLEKVTALTIDQFTQLMLGDPQDACFVVKGAAFQ